MSQHSHSDMEYWQVFFRLYREMPELWMVRSKEYRDRKRRDSAYGRLLEFLQKYDPNANIHTLKRKINNFRTSYRRELRKVLKSNGTYMPSLWYFKEFDFLYELETDEIQDDLERSRAAGMAIQSQSYMGLLAAKEEKSYHPEESSIYQYDGHQVQIASDVDDDDIFQDNFPIEEDALGIEGVSEVDHDPDHEVDPEPDPESESGPGKLDDYPNTSSVNLKSGPYSLHHRRLADKSVRIAPRIRRHSSNDSDYGENDAKRGRNDDIPMERERERVRERVRDRDRERVRERDRDRDRESDNECDLIGKRMAAHFRNMRPEQRLYAERIISEVLVYGRMNRLSMKARFIPENDK
ncbi:uncharacterized protein [Drosophila bipectinata]|uniref:uncharacterized protein isoform X2 n=1 Tax=Drosophila bipectinata TaxID=42026 RepID=UPI0038B231E4